MSRVLVGMSGGVDSSVAAGLLVDQGHDVVGATMKLWGGPSDSGCCSVADVDDARRVATQLGIDHHVFNFTADFERHVVEPYAAGHRAGRTPNPCIECNRHIKFARFLERAGQLGFDAVATGHHARIGARSGANSGPSNGAWVGAGPSLLRGADPLKDQSYVLAVLTPAQLGRVLLPIGELTKRQVREYALARGLRTAAKPDSQDVCFITASGGRAGFLAARGPLHPGTVVESGTGAPAGAVEHVELVTVGQRRGIGPGPDGRRRYVLATDVAARTVTIGPLEELLVEAISVGPFTWSGPPPGPGTPVEVQMSAHGRPVAGRVDGTLVRVDTPVRRVAPGQTVALYDGDRVLGSATAA